MQCGLLFMSFAQCYPTQQMYFCCIFSGEKVDFLIIWKSRIYMLLYFLSLITRRRLDILYMYHMTVHTWCFFLQMHVFFWQLQSSKTFSNDWEKEKFTYFSIFSTISVIFLAIRKGINLALKTLETWQLITWSCDYNRLFFLGFIC